MSENNNEKTYLENTLHSYLFFFFKYIYIDMFYVNKYQKVKKNK